MIKFDLLNFNIFFSCYTENVNFFLIKLSFILIIDLKYFVNFYEARRRFY